MVSNTKIYTGGYKMGFKVYS